MFKNYFKIAWRSLWKNKFYSIINITGLAVGFSAWLLIATVVVDELSYDKQWKHADQLYRLISLNNAIERTPNSFSALGTELKRNFPEVKEYCRHRTERRKDHPLLSTAFPDRIFNTRCKTIYRIGRMPGTD